MAPKTKSFHLDSALKQYTYDQDKSLDPKMTYKKAFQALEKTFPEKEISLKVINAKDFNIYDFGDGSLMSHGKGATQEQSKASAIMEFLERMSWLHFDYKNAPGHQKTSFNNLNQNHQ